MEAGDSNCPECLTNGGYFYWENYTCITYDNYSYMISEGYPPLDFSYGWTPSDCSFSN